MRLTNGADISTYRYMLDGIRYVCDNFKDRCAGTHSERKAQQFFKNELDNWADETYMEEFEVHPNAFLGWLPIAGIFCICSVVFYWLGFNKAVNDMGLSIAALVLTLLTFGCFIVEFLLYRKVVDFIFPQKTSRNVYAVRKPLQETKRRIVFCAHTDASFEWTYSLHGGLKSLAIVITGSVLGLVLLCLFNIFWFIYSCVSGAYTSSFWLAAGIVQLLFVPFFVAIMFFVNWKVVVDGANDNLTAGYISLGVLKEMAENNKRYENTEVCVLLTGSQEAGLRGADEFLKKHKSRFDDVETAVVVMDTMREIEQLQIYTQGCTGTQKNSNAVGELIYEAGVNCGIEMKEAKVYTGATDAEIFSRYGVEAAGFCGVNHTPKTYYHTRLDTADNVNESCINMSLDICLEMAELYDTQGGIDAFRKDGAKRFKKGYNKN